jgi:hypothetical protein
MVTASRRHLTERYAAGVDRLLWDTEKRLVPDLDAIKSVLAAVSSGHAEALDIGLVLLQAARLDVDRLEYEVFESAHAMAMGDEAIAAVLDLPDAVSASKRRRWLKARRALPYAGLEPSERPGMDASAEAAKRAGRRANQAAGRAAEAAQRREQLSQLGREHTSRQHVERAAANAGEARVLATEAAERVVLGLLRAAAGLDRCAAGCEDLASTDDARRLELRRKAEEYHQAAVKYREMAAQYRAADQVQDPRATLA